MSRLILARHGNTFGPEDKVVWVGAGTDLPLVSKGRDQARACARRLQEMSMVPSRVWAASLKRTQEFAAIVCSDLGLSDPVIDARLDEIHYGRWEAATTEEIAADPERARALEAWQHADIWPDCLGWQTTQGEVMANLSSVFSEIGLGRDDETVMIVSSNGILRFVPRLLGIDTVRSYRLKTGAMGAVESRAVRSGHHAPEGVDNDWRLLFWE